MLLDGSPPGSRWCAEICNAANRPASNQHSTPDLFRARFALLQRADHLNKHDQARLNQLFDTHPRLRAGWQALQELHGLYQAQQLRRQRTPRDMITPPKPADRSPRIRRVGSGLPASRNLRGD